MREGNGRGGGNGGGLGVEGVLMGGMVARRIEGMGPRIREETGGERGRGNGGWVSVARGNGRGGWERRGVGGRGGFNGGEGREGRGILGKEKLAVGGGLHPHPSLPPSRGKGKRGGGKGGTPILAFPRVRGKGGIGEGPECGAGSGGWGHPHPSASPVKGEGKGRGAGEGMGPRMRARARGQREGGGPFGPPPLGFPLGFWVARLGDYDPCLVGVDPVGHASLYLVLLNVDVYGPTTPSTPVGIFAMDFLTRTPARESYP